MRDSKTRGFTLVELLVVIGIIALLISILLPALSKAQEQARTIKCMSNLRQIGMGIAGYAAEYKGTLPASYIYAGFTLNGTDEEPTTPLYGYIHWSSYLFQDRSDSKFNTAAPKPGMTVANPGPFASTSGWEMFQCPSLDSGGLPPTNTFPGNYDPRTPVSDASGYVDYQAPRLAYTLNEALCPRNKFVLGFQGCVRTEHYVRAGIVRNSAGTILATEWNPDPSVVDDTGEVSGNLVCKSHRPVNGFTGLGNAGGSYVDLVNISPGTIGTIIRVNVNMLTKNPVSGFTAASRLDWVGRNHGVKKVDAQGWDIRKTNFLYLDGHAETKHIRDTISPWQWGDNIYTLNPNGDVLDR